MVMPDREVPAAILDERFDRYEDRRHGERHRPCPLVERGARTGPRDRHRHADPAVVPDAPWRTLARDSRIPAAWRFEVESGLAAARELLGMAEAPDLAGLVARADAVLAGDDRVFARQATRDHAEAWEERWQDLEKRAEDAGLSVHDHGSAAGAIARARRILEDPALPESHRERISGVVEACEARGEARRQAQAWLDAWEEHKSSDAVGAEAMIGDARRLVADPALPSTLQSRLTLVIERHDRLTRVIASPAVAETTSPAVETTVPAAADAVPREPVTPGRREDDAAPVRPAVVEDEKERERRRERAREAANRARQQAEAAHRQLEG